MGTRHLIIVYYHGVFVIAQYGQWDGYPEVQGCAVLKFLRIPGNLERLKQGLAHIYTPTKDEMASMNNEIQRLENEARIADPEGLDVRNFMRNFVHELYPSMSRDTGAGILVMVAGATAEKRIPIKLGLDFVYDSLFCEWAYVIDLDEELLEVYHGVEKENENSSQRFKDVVSTEGEDGFVPAIVKSFSFEDLPETDKEFLAVIDKVFGKKKEEVNNNEGGEGRH